MAPLTITVSEILAELERVGTAPDDAMTMMELSIATGWSRDKVRDDLLKLQASGRLLVHRVVRRGMDNRRQIVPAYTIAPKKRGKK